MRIRRQLVERIEWSAGRPVVVFGLEWCEFTWSARKVLDRYGIPFCAVDLDSVAYQEGDRGARIREVLHARTGIASLPLIFIGGELVGGCTDLFERLKNQRLAEPLLRVGVAYDLSANDDPYDDLPRWMHRR